MPSYKHRVRLLLQRMGVDLLRYPETDSMWKLTRLLVTNEIDLVLDVGANDGGYGGSIRRHGYAGKIVSFEPLSQPFEKLRRRTRKDVDWESLNLAVGAESGELVINVAGNDGASSSALPMLARHVAAAPTSAYIGTETVVASRLDDFAPGLIAARGASRVHLKIDVQGYERSVLDGAKALIASDSLVGLQLELSFVELYEGGMRWEEGFDLAREHGFQPMSIIPGFADFATGQTLQFDAIFFKPVASAA